MTIPWDLTDNERCACIPVNFSLLSDSHFKKLGVPESDNSLSVLRLHPLNLIRAVPGVGKHFAIFVALSLSQSN